MMSFSQKQITLPDYSKVRVFNKKNEECIIVKTIFSNDEGTIHLFSNKKDYKFKIPTTHIETMISFDDEVFEFRNDDLFEIMPILYKEFNPGSSVNCLDQTLIIKETDSVIVENGKVIVFYKTDSGIVRSDELG